MRIQLSRVNKIERDVRRATMPPPKAIVVSKFLDGHYEECYTHRLVTEAELDTYDGIDDFILVLEVGHTDDVHGNNMGDTENSIPCIE